MAHISRRSWLQVAGLGSLAGGATVAKGLVGSAQSVVLSQDSLAHSNHERYRPLAREKAVTEIDLDTARAAEDSANAEVVAAQATLKNQTTAVKYNIAKASAAVESAKADLALAQINLAYCTIYSPISGIIGLQEVNIGNLVGKDGPTLLASISSSGSLDVDFNISEAYLLKLTKTGQAGSRRGVGFELLLSDNTTYEHQGRFSVLDRTVDPKTGTIKVRASFPNASNRLRPGQFARLRVAAEEVSDAVLVPQVAVLELQSAKYVLVVGTDNKTSQRTIKVGDRYEDSYIVTEGLKAGERVVTEGVQKVMALEERAQRSAIRDKSRTFNTARVEALELDNLIETAKATVVSAEARRESRGAQARSDYPERDDVNFLKHTLWYRDGNRLAYKSVNMKPVSVDAFPPKVRTY